MDLNYELLDGEKISSEKCSQSSKEQSYSDGVNNTSIPETRDDEEPDVVCLTRKDTVLDTYDIEHDLHRDQDDTNTEKNHTSNGQTIKV